MSGAIQLREQSPLDTLVNEEWPRSIVELVKKQACPKGIPDGDFYVFMKKCQQTGLNPLTGEAFCVPRRTNIAPKGKEPEWVTLYQFQPSAEGMRTRAARFPDFAKIDGAAVFTNDTMANIDPGTGLVEHRFNAAKPRGVLMGAWGRVVKKDGTVVVVWLQAGSRNGQGEFWQKDPGGMLTKCAQVAALRQAYPVHFGGVYAREEMPDEHAEPSRAEQVLQRLDGQAQATEPERPALPPPSPGPVVEFGEWRGRAVADLTRGQVQEALAYGAKQQADAITWAKLKPALKAKVNASMAALQAALDAMPPEPEPTEEPLQDATNEAQTIAEPGAGG